MSNVQVNSKTRELHWRTGSRFQASIHTVTGVTLPGFQGRTIINPSDRRERKKQKQKKKERVKQHVLTISVANVCIVYGHTCSRTA